VCAEAFYNDYRITAIIVIIFTFLPKLTNYENATEKL
jgi:hypothetical protein